MKYLKNLLLLFIIVIATKSNAQINDSATVIHKVAGLQKQLSLSDKQCTEARVIYKELLQARDSVNNLNLTPENRNIFLAEARATYHRALQSILNIEQWQQYQAKQKAIQQAFEEHAKQQKIKYTLLNNQ